MILGETQMWRAAYNEAVAERDEARGQVEAERDRCARWEQEAAKWWEQAMRPAHLRDGDEDR